MNLTKQKYKVPFHARMGCDGGLNRFDAANKIKDNQSTDMLNMWYFKDALRARPGLIEKTQQQYGRIIGVYPCNGSPILLKRVKVNGLVTEEKYGIYLVTQKAILSFDGNSFFRVPNMMVYSNQQWIGSYQDLNLDSCILLPAGDGEYEKQGITDELSVTGCEMFLFGSGCFFTVGPYIITDSSGVSTAETIINYKTPYLPTLYTNTPPAGGGTALEARNYLSGRVRQLFTTDETSTVYRLCDSEIDDDTVEIGYDCVTGNAQSFTFYSGQTAAASQGLSAMLDRAAGTITFSAALVKASSYGVKNNLSITYTKTVYTDIPQFSCTSGIWFGDTNSHNGGNRMFLTGNPSYPDRVYYCGPNDPTYFPDDGFVTVGDPADPITAIGRHFNILAVFKKNSIYSLDFESQSDIAVKLINGGCGCDMPRSLQLIDNRLVWGSSRSGINTLLSTQIKDERTIVCVSRNVCNLLLSEDKTVLQNAVSVDTGNHYMLFAGSSVYLWDYRLAPYVNSSDRDETLRNLAWYYWKLPVPVDCVFSIDNQFYLSSDAALYTFDTEHSLDTAGWFEAYWYSKKQDFGEDTVLKLPDACRAGIDSGDESSYFLCYDDGSEEIREPLFAAGSSMVEIPRSGSFALNLRCGCRRNENDRSDFGLKWFDCCAIRGRKV